MLALIQSHHIWYIYVLFTKRYITLEGCVAITTKRSLKFFISEISTVYAGFVMENKKSTE